jgi:hypothetical protein
MQIRAMAGGAKLNKAADAAVERTFGRAHLQLDGSFPAKAWPGLLRKLDRIDPSYRN